MHQKKQILLMLMFSSITNADAIDAESDDLGTALDDIKVIGTRATIASKPPSVLPGNESANVVPPITSSAPEDTTHTTAQEVNNMSGISILGSSQSISQNISIGGQNQSNIIVGIDGVNNYFTNFGGNSTRLLPSTYLFKTATATQAGSDILYGSGNIGGAVNFTTLDPEDLLNGDKLTTLATLGVNSATNGTNTNAAFASRTGIVSYLFDVVASNDNNMALSNGTTLAYSANSNLQVLAKLGVDISRSQSLKLSFLGMQNNGQYPARINNAVGANNPPANFNIIQNQVTLDYSYNPDNPYVNIHAKSSYLINQYNLTTINNALGWYRDPQKITLDTGTLLIDNTTKVAWQKLLYGLEYTNIRGSDGYQSTRILNFPTASQAIYGIFFQDSWDITEKINLTVGTRYNAYQSQSQGYDNNSGGVFTNQVALNYKFLPDWLVYLGYFEGFQAPTLTNLYYNGYHEYSPTSAYIYQPNPGLLPEVAHNKTGGIKYDTLFTEDQHFIVAANAFLNNISNYAVWTYVGQSGSTNVTQMSNIPQTQTYGYDISLKYLTPWFGLNTNFTSTYGSTQTSYISGKNNYVAAGASLPIPQAKGFVGLDFPINPVDSIIQINANYALEQTNTPDTIVYGNMTSVPAYVLYGLSYTWKPKGSLRKLEAMVGVDNLFNTNYQTYNGSSMFPGEARNIYAQASYKY